MTKTITREFDYAVVTAELVKYNPTGYDDWAVTVEPKDGDETFETHELADLFDNGESVAEKAYREWMKENI